jgi:ribonuclease P/MRP protein subunit RPP40
MAKLITVIKKFADDTRLRQVIKTQDDRDQLQSCLNQMAGWAEIWGMSFNMRKCKVMDICPKNPGYEYMMGRTQLSTTKEERDIGVTVYNNLKPGAQCSKAAGTASAVLAQVSRAYHYKDRFTFINLYKQYVRPHLEFVVQAWSPWLQQDKEVLERVQKRAVKMVSGLQGTSYQEKLEELDLNTLEERRHQADMLQMYKIITGKDSVMREQWFKMAADAMVRTRQAAGLLNVIKPRARLGVRINFFSVRTADDWNVVPEKIKMARTAAHFKKLYNTFRCSRQQQGGPR